MTDAVLTNLLPEVLVTERLTLQPWRFEHAPDVFRMAQDPEWSRYLPVPVPYTEQDAHKFIANQVLLDRKAHSSWVILRDRTVAGGLNLRMSSESRVAELGYSIERSYRGIGYATEAARAVISAAFQNLPGLIRVCAMADSRNAASIRVLEKLPMQREGVLRSNRFNRDEPVDEAWYGVLRAEWFS